MRLKELLTLAKEELKDLSTLDNPDFRLEEATFIESKGLWEIVVSYLVENTNPRENAFSTFTDAFKYLRLYKRLSINANKEIEGFYMYEKQ